MCLSRIAPRLARHNATRAPVRLTLAMNALVAAPRSLARSSPCASRRAPPRAARSRSPRSRRRANRRARDLRLLLRRFLLVHDPGASTTPRASRSPVAAASSSIDVIPGDYRIGGVLLGVAAFLGPVCHLWTQFGVHGVLAFLAFQASRVRFRFSDTDLDVVFIEPADDSTALDVDTNRAGTTSSRAAARTSGASRVRPTGSFGSPASRSYYKDQTRPEGQPHFFPIIMDGKKLYETMLAKMPASVNPKPDPSEGTSTPRSRRPSSEGRSRKT